MRKLRESWNRLPRWSRAALNIGLIAVLLLVIYFCIDAPALTVRHQYRRAEQANLVGPGVIVDILDREDYNEFAHTVVAETENGVIFCGISDSRSEMLSYREKAGDITVLAAPTHTIGEWARDLADHRLPVYVFDDYPQAAWAELELAVSGAYQVDNENFGTFSEVFSLAAERESDGFFRFFIDAPFAYPGDQGVRAAAAQMLSRISNGFYWHGYDSHLIDQTAAATVRLYDGNGNVLIEKDLTLRTLAGEVNMERAQ